MDVVEAVGVELADPRRQGHPVASPFEQFVRARRIRFSFGLVTSGDVRRAGGGRSTGFRPVIAPWTGSRA
ncbi:hypothetical protein Ae356Ps1_4043c [Pseudonocardia sp. Ae356_Ps1]|nr:hypothetical protein Ae356Ps1_4043c [Pseudonocardia sp. Ae356_Ps1]